MTVLSQDHTPSPHGPHAHKTGYRIFQAGLGILSYFIISCERFALVALNKRGTMRNSLRLLMTKELLWANCSLLSLKKSNKNDLLVIRANRSQKRAIHLKNSYFSYILQFFTTFPHFYAQELISPVSLCSVTLYLRVTGARVNRSFALSLTKTSDLLEKPMSEFPTLLSGWWEGGGGG